MFVTKLPTYRLATWFLTENWQVFKHFSFNTRLTAGTRARKGVSEPQSPVFVTVFTIISLAAVVLKNATFRQCDAS